jgi:SrtB family sortase
MRFTERKNKKTKMPLRQQGCPAVEPDLHRQGMKNRFVRAGARSAPGRRSRLNIVLLCTGLLLAASGSWMLAGQMIAGLNRQRDAASLQAIYYASADTGNQSEQLPAQAVVTDVSPVPPPDTEKSVRTFNTRAPWASYVTRERFVALRKINPDVVGWLSIDGMLDQPVVQRDNSYYLTHDFHKKVSVSGALFLDENFSFYPPCESLLVHGHNMRDGSMFGQLKKYRERAYYINHSLIRFDTLYETGEYAVFAAFIAHNSAMDTAFFSFRITHFDTDLQFSEYITAVKKESFYPCGLDIAPSDSLLILSTCADGEDNYFVLAARRLRDGEKAADVKMICVMTSQL